MSVDKSDVSGMIHKMYSWYLSVGLKISRHPPVLDVSSFLRLRNQVSHP
jgi:hypothetical protein